MGILHIKFEILHPNSVLSIENIRVFYFCYVVDNPITIHDGRPVAVVQPMQRQHTYHDDDDDNDDVDVGDDSFMGDDEDENDNIADDNDDNDANAHVINILLQIRELINGLINYLTQQ